MEVFNLLKKSLILVPLVALGLSSTYHPVLAEESNLDVARDYIESNVSKINGVMNVLEMAQKDLSSDQVQEVISNYYKEHPAPQDLITDKDLTIEDIYPNKENDVNFQPQNASLSLEELMEDAKDNPYSEGHTYEFSNDEDETSVYVSNTGEVMISTSTIMPSVKSVDDNRTTFTTLAASSYKNTKTKRTTGIAYNALGLKTFTLWAEGSFKYNKSSAKHANADGDVQRHLFGSTLEMVNKAVGKKRTVYEGKQSYPEVYTRVYFESTIGIRWAGVVIKSATVETYVGATKIGSLYGGLKRL